ncbi:TPA: hypothetical protein EYP83_04480 [Candidatus Geothermarchaeota archaeon]|nr:hypothetical protein [Candidatus Geothermarchaeota archaeon]HIQ13363.1 hypothetical protein [Thermoprotei archaeon]
MNSNSNSKPHHSFYNLIGRPIIENYGRYKARIISYKVDPKGDIDKIFISNNGVIIFKDSSSIHFDGGVIKVVPPVINKAYKTLDDLQYIFLQVKTLNNILSVDPRLDYIEKYYKIFRERYEKHLSNISRLLKELDGRRRYLNKIISEYKEGLFNLELGIQSGDIDNDIYKLCYNELSDEILRLSAELEDVENLISDLSSVSTSIGELLDRIWGSLSIKEVVKYEEEKI